MGIEADERPGGGTEWIGARFPLPGYVTGEGEPYRPECVLWMELPDGLVVGQDVVLPHDASGALRRLLLTALDPPQPQPLTGPRRPPARLRVADASSAAEIRLAGTGLPVVVAPVPELDGLVQELSAAMPPGDEPGYLEDGLSAARMADVFATAKLLYQLAPWETLDDDQPLRMDAPELGIEGACVVIIGALGESLGVLIFPSGDAYHAFADAPGPEQAPEPGTGLADLGSGWLALHFVGADELSEPMLRDVAEHGWPIANVDAYPVVERRERHGIPVPLEDEDLRIAAACASSLTAFFIRHGHELAGDRLDPVSESYEDGDGLIVRYTLPYEAFALDEDSGPLPDAAVPRPGRNDPCPCGSGRKYKKCHLAADEAQGIALRAAERTHELDHRLVSRLSDFARERLEPAFLDFTKDFADSDATVQLAVPWSVFGYRVDGHTVLDRFLEDAGRRLSREERAWLAAQAAAWLSVWEVTGVEPGRELALRDLLSHEERVVIEVSGSQTLQVGDTLVGRIVDAEGQSYLCGVHPRPLFPHAAAEVVRRARGRLRRKHAVPVERLRDADFGCYLIRRWEEAVRKCDRGAIPKNVTNTDGEALLFTTDHFAFDPAEHDEVAARLAALPGVEPPDPEEDPAEFVFTRPGFRGAPGMPNTVLGHARLTDGELQLETNSTERADRLRAQIESACDGRLRHRSRAITDLGPETTRARRRPRTGPPPPLQLGLPFE